MNRLFNVFKRGITVDNPTFCLLLGLCPTLAVSTSVINALGMGAAATFVLLGSNIIVSSIKKIVPKQIRLPCFIVVIATFVTIVELVMKAYFPDLNKSLGIFVPLIVVNCVILGRAEAFASKNAVMPSIFDALGMGAGFTIALVMVAAVREILGAGTFLGITLFENFEPAIMFVLAPGALLTLGILIGINNFVRIKKNKPVKTQVGCGGC